MKNLHKVNLGVLRLLGIIQRQVKTTSSTTNEDIITWENVTGNIRFAKHRQSGRENYEANQETAVSTVMIVTHFMTGIDETMRIESLREQDAQGNNIYYYFKEVDPEQDRRFLNIIAEKRT